MISSLPAAIRWIAAAVAVVVLLSATIAVRTPRPDVATLAGATVLVALSLPFAVRHLRRTHRSDHRATLIEQTDLAQRRFETLLRHAGEVVLLLLPGRGVVLSSPSAERLLGVDPTGWPVSRLVRSLHPEDRAAVLRAAAEHRRTGAATPLRFSARLREDSSTETHVEVVVADHSDDADLGGVALTVRETTERASLERELRHQAQHDQLTGLGNRQLLQHHLESALESSRDEDQPLALLMCDLDDFKHVNDALGHAVGDELLIEFARRMSAAIRASDRVARLGGDEFAVLCERVGSTRDAVNAARRLLEITRQPFEVRGHRLRASMSVGVVVDRGHRTAQDLLRDGDVALYIAKERGKDRVALHRATMTEETRARLQLADDLKLAIEQQALKVAFQPIIDLTTQRIVGVEALARWRHPTRGPISPAEFIPVAEQSGLVPALGDLVLTRTLESLRMWGRLVPDLDLYAAVNLSARELREPDAVARIADRLHHHGVAPERVLLELTESAMLEDEQVALHVMHQLRAHGLRFAVDDFGTGYSSLSYLRRLPVDVVKIDRSFVEELGVDDTADDLVRAIIDLSRALHLDVVAEGIETDEQRRILEALGCGLAQGYRLGRPTDELAILHLLEADQGTADTDDEVAAADTERGAIAPR